jgi:transcriptional regulator with XRE-family HTH domain
MVIISDLIQIRKDRKIDQKHLLRILGINKTTMSRYESGKRKMPFDIILKYADYLGYEIRLLKKNN